MEKLNTLDRLRFVAGWFAVLMAGCIAAGCGSNPPAKQAQGPAAAAAENPGLASEGSKPEEESPKLKVAYLGLTCEAPIFVAQEQGFFKEEGLDVELVKTDWDGLREGLGLGRFDANHTLIMYLLKPIEQGLDVKITGGIHTGCLRVQAGVKSDIKSVADLKGKKIGVPTHLGSPPFLFASRVLVASGIDPSPEKEEVIWEVFPPDVLGQALEDGRIDAVATSDPIGTILLGQGLVRTIADQAEDPPYSEEYCCAAVVSGKLAKQNPAAAAKVTRALLKGAKWVGQNPATAARLSVEKKYLASSIEINTQAISKLKYLPGVSSCRQSVDQAALEMKKAGLLKPSTDPAALAKRAWLDLDGVTDEWVGDLEIATAENDRPEVLSPEAFAALFKEKGLCCGCCCLDE
ncbi:MAG TPA: ABC transporter substrate-binding protein [Pirellulales bacterium]|nr:ABC transporter substrate-binding protein [Pirellulales bacterium]